MANDSITFLCPACSIKLTVPGSLAGVIGPCPSCQNQIQAPYPAPVQPQAPVAYQAPATYQPPAAYQAPATPAPYQAPPQPEPPAQYQAPATPAPYLAPVPQQVPTSYQEPAPLPPPAAYQTTPAAQAPVQEMPAAQVSQVASLPQAPQLDYAPPVQQVAIPAPLGESQSPSYVKMEPRQLPSRTTVTEPVARPMPERKRESESAAAGKAHPKHSHPRNRLVRLFVPLLTIFAITGVVYGVLQVLKYKDAAIYPPRTTDSTVNTRTPGDDTRTKPFQPQDGKMPDVLPVSDPDQPIIVEPPPDLPSGLDPADPGLAAEDAVHAFLAAKTLAERLPMLETKTPESELEKSCLAGPLPVSSGVVMEFRETNPVEHVIDFYYGVDFDAGENRVNPHTVLVRKRGSEAPKIVADPFLDCFGGRLAAYASKPTEKAGFFQVIVSPLAECNDAKIPNAAKKHTLKLLARDQPKEIARAYFGKQSKIGRMLEDRTYSMNFGKALPCTVMLSWNTEDDKERPYLEALDIKSLDWNP